MHLETSGAQRPGRLALNGSVGRPAGGAALRDCARRRTSPRRPHLHVCASSADRCWGGVAMTFCLRLFVVLCCWWRIEIDGFMCVFESGISPFVCVVRCLFLIMKMFMEIIDFFSCGWTYVKVMHRWLTMYQ